jgi:hypothetical protein
MSSIKKRQHYVWRNYLRSWSENDNIWTHFKELNKTERPNLMGVAQERYFYRLIDFTVDEEVFLKLFVENISHPSVKDFNLDFFRMFTINRELKKALEQNKNPLINVAYFEEEIRKIEINLMEDAHTKMENMGEKLINYRNLEDLKTILHDDYHFDALMFLCFQYFRTRKMKNAVLKEHKGSKHEVLMEKSWNILSYAFATTLTRNIALNERLKFIFIHNNTDNHFTTGDQPVFNILGDKLDDNGNVIELELYYPLTPRHALNIHFREDQENQFEDKYADNELVNYLNRKVFENAEYYVFADTKEQLEKV